MNTTSFMVAVVLFGINVFCGIIGSYPLLNMFLAGCVFSVITYHSVRWYDQYKKKKHVANLLVSADTFVTATLNRK